MWTLTFPRTDVAELALDDPSKSVNLLSRAAIAELDAHLAALAARTDLAGLFLCSGKPESCIAGADLKAVVAEMDAAPERIAERCQEGQRVFSRLATMPCVTVAGIHGACLGGGTELALWCDRRALTDHPRTCLGFPEVKLGLVPGWGGTARAPRLAGLGGAIEWIAGGEPISPAQARGAGLADVVVRLGSGSTTADGLSPREALRRAALGVIDREREAPAFEADRVRRAAPLTLSDAELAFLAATAAAYLHGQTKGRYPAPLAALELLVEAARVDLREACRLESEAFARLFGSPVNRALTNVFFLRERSKGPTAATAEPPRTAGVAGAGVMGRGIAAACARHGVAVVMTDQTEASVQQGVHAALEEASYDRSLKGPAVDRLLRYSPLLRGTAGLAELARAEVVVEAISENRAAKQAFYAAVEPLLSPQAVLASNTSTIPIAELAKGLARPERFCGLHFFNPVRSMPLVEVVRGPQTSDDTIARAVGLARQLGKTPIIVGDGPGFLVNRVLLPYLDESLALLEEGASIESIDAAAADWGMPMGPLTLLDTVGLDVAWHAGSFLHQAFPDRARPSSVLPALMAAGRLGHKSGGGFYDYRDGQRRPQPSAAAAEAIAGCRRGDRRHDAEEMLDRMLLPMLLEAARVVEDGVAAEPSVVDLALIYGIGFPPFQGGLFYWADAQGVDRLRKRLAPLAALGGRFVPSPYFRERLESGQPFYPSLARSRRG